MNYYYNRFYPYILCSVDESVSTSSIKKWISFIMISTPIIFSSSSARFYSRPHFYLAARWILSHVFFEIDWICLKLGIAFNSLSISYDMPTPLSSSHFENTLAIAFTKDGEAKIFWAIRQRIPGNSAWSALALASIKLISKKMVIYLGTSLHTPWGCRKVTCHTIFFLLPSSI